MADIYKVYVQAIGGGSPEIREYDSMPTALEDFERSCCPQNTLVQLLHVTPKTTHVHLVWSPSDEEANCGDGNSLQGATSNMKRRAFIERTLLAAGAACVPWPASGESPYLEDHSRNWREWRESLKRVLEETGHRFRWAELERPIGGFRRATVHVTDETGTTKTLTWFQPWRGNRIDE